MQKTRIWSLGQKDPLEKGTAIHFCILAWRIPRTEEPGRLQSMRLKRVGHDWVTNTFTFTFWRLEVQNQGTSRATIPLRLGRILPCLFLAFGGGHQPLAFLGLSDASLQYLSWLSHDILPVHPNFPLLIRTPVILDWGYPNDLPLTWSHP